MPVLDLTLRAQLKITVYAKTACLPMCNLRLGRDEPETVKLTGIYHSLIRYWAEV